MLPVQPQGGRNAHNAVKVDQALPLRRLVHTAVDQFMAQNGCLQLA
ncbi:hypothetical protein L579_3500 [Pantoea sp. AS-PWVM4]|nr:hypothetical protein L579_3500 [Pantoea sp. AS-PWVM4]